MTNTTVPAVRTGFGNLGHATEVGVGPGRRKIIIFGKRGRQRKQHNDKKARKTTNQIFKAKI